MTVLWLNKFYCNQLSSNPSDWSSFATLFSGILTPFIGILNIFVFIHLTNKISSFDESRNKSEINTQIKIIQYQTQLTELRLIRKDYSKIEIHYRNNTCPTYNDLECLHRNLNNFIFNPEIYDFKNDLISEEEKAGQVVLDNIENLLEVLNTSDVEMKKNRLEEVFDSTNDFIFSTSQMMIDNLQNK